MADMWNETLMDFYDAGEFILDGVVDGAEVVGDAVVGGAEVVGDAFVGAATAVEGADLAALAALGFDTAAMSSTELIAAAIAAGIII